MDEVVINGAAITDKAALHSFLAAQMHFPEWYGGNLDALFDCLTDVHTPTRIRVTEKNSLKKSLGSYADRFLRLLTDASTENPDLQIVFEDVNENADTPIKAVTEVVAALIRDGNKFMICQRPAHKARGLLWEFVGGKVEPGETKEEALARECREELGIIVHAESLFAELTHAYPDLTVHLSLFNAVIAEGIPQKLEHNDIRWITADEIGQYEFCPADQEILDRLKQEA